jgi:transcriptional regulator with XRE-family HTH domain
VWYRESNHGIEVLEAASVVQIAQKFEHFLDVYRRPDGSRWGGQDLHNATGGVVTRSYVSNLRKGRIENPGFEKLRAIAKAMNLPPELCFEDVENLRDVSGVHPSWFVDD